MKLARARWGRLVLLLALLRLLELSGRSLFAQLLTPKEIADAALADGGAVDVLTSTGATVALVKGATWPDPKAQIIHITDVFATSFGTLHMQSIGALSQLRLLSLGRAQFSGDDLIYLRNSRELNNLQLFQIARLADAGWEYVAELPKMTTLSMVSAKLSNAGLAKLTPMHLLVSLNLDHTLIDDEGAKLLTNFPKVGFINLDSVAITDAGIKPLVELTNLARLILAHTLITEDSFPTLALLRRVTDLNIRETAPTPLAVQRLQLMMPWCKVTPSIPAISQQPGSVSTTAGQTITLKVAALGPTPITYQWYFGVGVIAGQTNAELTLRNVTTNQSGLYHAVLLNANGGTTSSNATVIIQPPLSPPRNDLFANRESLSGSSLTLSASNQNATREPGEHCWRPLALVELGFAHRCASLGEHLRRFGRYGSRSLRRKLPFDTQTCREQ